MDVINVYTIILVSFFGGFLGSLVGLGGASIITPILVGLGFPLKHSIANAMISVIATSAGSSAAYVRDRITNIRVAMFLEVFTIIGGIVGASLVLILPSVVLYFFFAFFLLFMQIYGSYIERRIILAEEWTEDSSLDKFSRWLGIRGEYYDHSDKKVIRYVIRRAHIGGPMMIIAGVAAGSLGIGAGAFKTSIQESILGLPVKVASATSNFIVGMTGLAAATIYVTTGYLNPIIAGSMALGTTLGSVLGSRVLPKIRISVVKRLSLVVVMYIIAQMLYKGVASIWI